MSIQGNLQDEPIVVNQNDEHLEVHRYYEENTHDVHNQLEVEVGIMTEVVDHPSLEPIIIAVQVDKEAFIKAPIFLEEDNQREFGHANIDLVTKDKEAQTPRDNILQ